jgi:hypothetical protein
MVKTENEVRDPIEGVFGRQASDFASKEIVSGLNYLAWPGCNIALRRRFLLVARIGDAAETTSKP